MGNENKKDVDRNSNESQVDSIVRFRNALEHIAGFENMTLLGEYCNTDEAADKQHRIGANKAYNQCAHIAKEALKKP